MSRPLSLIINGKASGDPDLRAAVKTLRGEGVVIEPHVTWEAGDAARFAARAAREGVPVVVAAGGDGTVSEVAGGLVSAGEPCETALAVVPYGTANDFATACGIPKDDPLAALRLAATGESTRIDVGQANGRTFINVASGGFGAEVTANTPTQMKKVLGGAAYSIMGLVTAAKMSLYRGRFITPDGQSHGEMIIMAVGNSRLAGGGYPVAPKALLNDGLLDVMAIVDVEPRDFGVLLSELMTLGDPSHKHAVYRQLKSFRIESETPLNMNLDGEPMLLAAYDFQVLPGRIACILPPNCPLVQ